MAKPFELTAEIEQLLREAYNEFSPRTELTGVDFGYRYDDGHRTDELAIRFHVPQKIKPAASLGEELLPKEYKGYPTDVLAAPLDFTHGRVAVEKRTQRANPQQPGISVSHGGQGAGTLGAIVFRRGDGAPAILSCWHVLAHSQARRGDPIYQPSPVDRGDIRFDAVATLEDWLIDADGDAAIALLNRSRIVERGQFETAAVLTEARPVRGGEVLTKSGRGTGVTSALVDGIGLYLIQVGDAPRTLIRGFHLVPVEGAVGEISSFGDSGSVWYGIGAGGVGQGVGLHIDGEHTDEEPEFAIACHLPAVLDRFDVSLSPPAASLEVLAVEDEPARPEIPEAFLKWASSNLELLKGLVRSLEPAGNGGDKKPNGKDYETAEGVAPAAIISLAAETARPKNGRKGTQVR